MSGWQPPNMLAVGDRMRVSVELLQEWKADPRLTSELVIVQDIRTEADGTKTLLLTRATPHVPQA